jgi:NTE family protein
MQDSHRLGLALGGGGGKGAAHIGVLHALGVLGVPIDVVAGTSIGGIVAALYGAGYDPFEIEQWFLKATARRILERDPTSSGLLGTRRIELLLREAIGDRTFADTRVPLAMVAVDIGTAEEVILREGSLVEAVLATIAVPGVFPPHTRGDRVLVDGGVLNNVPVDVARGLAGRVIAVDLGMIAPTFVVQPPVEELSVIWSPRRWLPRTQITIAERALSIMMAQLTEHRLKLHPPDVLLRPSVGTVLPFDFSRTIEGRLLGERAVFEQRAAIESLKRWRESPAHADRDPDDDS